MRRSWLKELMLKLLQSSIFEMFAEGRIAKRVVPMVPWKIQKALLSSLIRPRNIEFKIDNHELSIFCSMEDDHFQRAYLQKMQGWESQSLSAFLKLIEPGSTVIDVGAYLGIYSILAIKQGARNVISYEPNPNTYLRLLESLASNKLRDGVITRNVALGERFGSSLFIAPIGRNLSSGAKIIENDTQIPLGWEIIANVPTRTLDEDLKTIGLKQISVIKIDAEGAELEILKGAEATIKAQSPAIICEFLTSESLEKAVNIIFPLGYSRVNPLFKTSVENDEMQIYSWHGEGNYLFQLAH